MASTAKSFDGRGNFAMGLKEHIVFPEISYDQIETDLGHGHHCVHHGARPTKKRKHSSRSLASPSVQSGAGENDMAKKSVDRERTTAGNGWSEQYAKKRAELKAARATTKACPLEDRFDARLKLAELPRNSAAVPHSQPLRESPAGRAPTTAS